MRVKSKWKRSFLGFLGGLWRLCWALLEPFPVAQIHAFDEKGWYRSVGYYRRGSVPERVVVHLYSSEGDLLMSVRTKAIKAGEGEKKP